MAHSTTAYVRQINISPGGLPKTPITLAEVTATGITGDRHRDTRHHGGPDRAICLFGWELIEALQAEGHPITPGAVGENLTTVGIDYALLRPGDRLQIGPQVLLEITQPTTPCQNIRDAFMDGRFVRISQKVHPGWSRFYARVLRGGIIRPGDPITIHPINETAARAAFC